jgi:hypothetical protein
METTGITEIMETADIIEIANSNPQIRRRRNHSIAMLMQRSGVRNIIP